MRLSLPEEKQNHKKFIQLHSPYNNAISSLPTSSTDQDCSSRKRKAKSPDENCIPAKRSMKIVENENCLQMTDSLHCLMSSYADEDSDERSPINQSESSVSELLPSKGQLNPDKVSSCPAGSITASIFMEAFAMKINDIPVASSTKKENNSSVQVAGSVQCATDEGISTEEAGSSFVKPFSSKAQFIYQGFLRENDETTGTVSTKTVKKTNDDSGTSSAIKTNADKTSEIRVANSSKNRSVSKKVQASDVGVPSSPEKVYTVEDFSLDKDFWKNQSETSESLWNDSFDAVKISLMRTEFIQARDHYHPFAEDIDETETSSETSLPSVIILDKYVKMIGATKDVGYWIKERGKTVNRLDWFDPKNIGEDLKIDYDKREQVVEEFAKNLQKRMGKKAFEKECPHFKHRKDFLKTGASAAWRLKLREIECYWNSIIKKTGQAEVYIEDWSGFNGEHKKSPWEFDIGTCPEKFSLSNRRVLNFQYLVKNAIPQHLADKLYEYEMNHVSDVTYNCTCEGECGNKCNCNRYSFVRMNKNGVNFRDEENPLYTPCGMLCNCPPQCKRRLLLGRQEPLIVFYTGNRGWGVFSTRKIKAGTFIGVYTGELKVHESEDTSYQFRIPTILKKNPEDDNEKEQDLSLESACAGNEFSLINHACKNTNVRTFHLANKNRFNMHDIGFVTVKSLEAGEELLYNYFQRGGSGTKDICWCSPKCPNKHFPLH